MARLKIILILTSLSVAIISLNLASEIRSTPIPIKLGKYHDSEGSLFSHDNQLFHIFRSTSEYGDHVSNDGYIGMRKSINGGASWSEIEIISAGYYDYRNTRASILDDGKIIVFFRIYDADNSQPISLNYIYSDQNQENWTSPKRVFNDLNFEEYFEAWIDNVSQRDNRLFITLHSVGFISIYSSQLNLDNLSFEKIYLKDFRDDPDFKYIDEPELIFTKNNEVFLFFRDEQYPNNQNMGFFVMKSIDNAASFSEPVRTNICNYDYAKPVAPHGFTHEESIYILGSYRMMSTSSSKFDGWCLFSENSESDDFTEFHEYLNIGRPFQNSHMFYGYLISEKLTENKRLFIFTESFKDEDGRENADFYQFVLSLDNKFLNYEESSAKLFEKVFIEITPQSKGQISHPSSKNKKIFKVSNSQDQLYNAPFMIRPFLSLSEDKRANWLANVIEDGLDLIISEDDITDEQIYFLDLNNDGKFTLGDVLILYQKLNNIVNGEIAIFSINDIKLNDEHIVSSNNTQLNLDGFIIGNHNNSFEFLDDDLCPEFIGLNSIVLDQSNDYETKLNIFHQNNSIFTIKMDGINSIYFDQINNSVRYIGNIGNKEYEFHRANFTVLEPSGCNKSKEFNIIITKEDIDNDGVQNFDDNDMDGDGWHNELDEFFWDADEYLDTDADGIGNNSDNDIDGDGILNSLDNDIDGDGKLNESDEDDKNPYI